MQRHDDIARRFFAELEAENARLKAEVERLEKGIQPEGSNDAVGRAVNVLLEKEKEIARLKAEVERLEEALKDEQAVAGHRGDVNERLRRAGDAMYRAIKVSDPILDWKIELWNAAKEGKQS